MYEEVPNDLNILNNSINQALEKRSFHGDLSSVTHSYFLLRIPNLLDSILHQKFINVYMAYQVAQLF